MAPILLVIAALAIAVHSPGQMSVDTVIALKEASEGQAIGWGPPFFASLFVLLGRGEVAAALLVAISALLTYGALGRAFSRAPRALPGWRWVLALALVANPVLFLMVGVLWKDVMLASFAIASAALLSEFELRFGSKSGLVALLVALILIASLPLMRQQGILLALPLAVAAGIIVGRRGGSWKKMLLGLFMVLTAVSLFCLLLTRWSRTVIQPLPESPVSVGLSTVMAYDIVGMMAFGAPGSRAEWSGASSEVVHRARALYSPERIDTLWRDPEVRHFIDQRRPGSLVAVWFAGVKSDPLAYMSHRRAALASLLGFGALAGCVPGYWGVAGPPDMLEALGLREEMDARDRVVGRWLTWLQDGWLLRHWLYLTILALAGVALARRGLRRVSPVAVAMWVGGMLYAASYVVTTIACDFRYLYPVAVLATALWVHILLLSDVEEVRRCS